MENFTENFERITAMGKLEILKDLCRERGISINKLEQELGFSQGSLGKIDTNVPKADKLYAIAQYFQVPMEIFFEENIESEHSAVYPTAQPSDFVVKLLQDKELYLLIERIISSDDEQRAKFIQIGKLLGLL